MEKPAIETVVNGDEIIEIDYSQFVTEDDTPVESIFVEKQQRLLTSALYISWQPARPFAAFANVGLFYALAEPAVVPDAMLSLDVTLPENAWEKPNRSYFVWKYGKAPEVVIEVVSNLKGQELTEKMDKYAKIGIPYYVVYDPAQHYGLPVLRVFENLARRYLPRANAQFDDLGLSLVVWQGEYEGMAADWLRWSLPSGELIPTGHEQRLRADRLAQRLRELGLRSSQPPQFIYRLNGSFSD